MKPLKISKLNEMADDMVEVLGLERSPVGVKFIEDKGEACTEERNVFHQHRYCQAVMKAGRGKAGVVDGGSLACPAASAAFGFSKLPPKLRSGEGLTGFGIVSDPEVGKTMFDRMPRLEEGEVEQLSLSPLEGREGLLELLEGAGYSVPEG
ncbi:DUF169 domain-containing protein [Candidatus Bipolaricaulota bacterium]|nr:DUF169 domain-containing protein [Candidatus Bipolaricaulota bacterium]